ncbi:MAG TPA: histidine kinase [Phycicoccus sp.]|nr:histidine kinase [Phycicoccus sp.]
MPLVDRLRTTRLDAALALAFTVAGLVQLVAFPFASPFVGAVYVLGSTLPLAWRRTHPVESSLVSSAFWLVPLDGYPVLGFVVVLLQFFALGHRGEPRLAVGLVTGWAAAASAIGTLLGPELPVAAVGGVLVVVAPVLAGRLVRHQQLQNQALASLTRQLREERSRAEEAAVGAERARIAQELHDVVGHEVTHIAIQAEAAAAALRVAPERAAEPVEAIRTTAHRTMAEIREVLDVLSPLDEARVTAPESLVALTDRARSLGVPNTLEVTGTPAADQSPADLALHRIVRECLTNAGRHAPGEPLSLRVDWQPGEVVLTAANRAECAGRAEGAEGPDSPAGVRPGRGLTGVRHRAELLGGTFHAACREGRFEVRVTIPTDHRGAP